MALTRITGTVIKDGGLQNADLPDSGVTANSYGSGTAIPVLTVNSKGIVTSVSTTSVAGVSSLSWDTGTEVLTLSTADGGSYTADLSGMASQGYVDTAINNLIAAAPGTLNTLDELAAALGDDANFASTVTTSLAGKVDKINITGATVGSASQVPVITFNSQGQITSATSTAVAGVSALSYNQSTGVLTIDTADGGQFTTDIVVGQDDQPEFTNVFINDTGSTLRGIARTDAAYNLNLMGGADQTDGAMITVNGGQRGGAGNALNASLEFYTGSDYAASQSAVVGDYYFKTQWLGNSKILMSIDSSTGYVGINATPSATLTVGGNIAVTGTVDGRDLTADGTKLDGIEVGATADQTKSDIDALGINAAQVDGLEASQFLRSDADDTTTGKLSVGSGTAGSMQLNVNGDIYLGDNSGTTFGVYSGGSVAMGSDGSVFIVGDANTASPSSANTVIIGFGNTAGINYDQSTGSALDPLSAAAISTASFYTDRTRFHQTIVIDPKAAPTTTSEGAMYYDSNDNCVKFYNGSSWIPLTGLINRYSYTATASQTTFNATYSGSNVDVFLNGIKLVPTTDFTASNGTSVVLTAGADAGDLVDIVAQTSSFAQSNAVPATGGTFTGTVSFDGASTNINVGNTVNASNLRLTNTGDLSLGGSGHAFQIGSTTGVNLAMDSNEIMARNNGVVEQLHLQAEGGNVTINNNNTGTSKLIVNGKTFIGGTEGDNAFTTELSVLGKATIADSTNGGQVRVRGLDASLWLDITGTNNAKIYYDNNSLEFRSGYPTAEGVSGVSTVRAELSQAGRWSVPSQPAFEMIKTTDTTGTANANNYIRYDLVQFETGGSGCSTSTGLYTAPVDGLYHFAITFTVDAGAGSDDSIGVGFVIANNSYYNQDYSPNLGHRINPNFDSRAGIEHTYSFQKTARLSAGATVGFYLRDWDATNTVLHHAEFSGHKFA